MSITVKPLAEIGTAPRQYTHKSTLGKSIAVVGFAILVAATMGTAQPASASEWSCMLAKKTGKQAMIDQHCNSVASERGCMLAKKTGKQALTERYCDAVPVFAKAPREPSKPDHAARANLNQVNLE